MYWLIWFGDLVAGLLRFSEIRVGLDFSISFS
jgi:hypothetical protein